MRPPPDEPPLIRPGPAPLAARRRTDSGDRRGAPPQPRARNRRQRRRLRRHEGPAARRAGGRAGSVAHRQHLHERVQRRHLRSVFLRRLPLGGIRDERVCGGGRDRRPGGRERDHWRRVRSGAHCRRLRLLLHAAQHDGPLGDSAAGAGYVACCRRQLSVVGTARRRDVDRGQGPRSRRPVLHRRRRHAAALSGPAGRARVRCVDSDGRAPAGARRSPSRDRREAGAQVQVERCRRRPATAVGRPRRTVSADQPRHQGPARRTAQNHTSALLAARSVGGRSDPADRYRHRRRVGVAPDERVPQRREPAPVGGAGATRRTGGQDGARRDPRAPGTTAPHRSAVPVCRGWIARFAVCAVDVHGYPGALHGRARRAARHGTRCERDAADCRRGDAGRRALRHRSGASRHVGTGGDGAARRRWRHLRRARRIAAACVARRRADRHSRPRFFWQPALPCRVSRRRSMPVSVRPPGT